MKEQEKLEKEMERFYPQTPEGQSQRSEDYKLFKNRSLPHESELKLDKVNLRLYREPIIDSL